MDIDERAYAVRVHAVPRRGDVRLGPFEDPRRVFRRQVHAAVRVRVAESLVPERRVQRVATLEILHVRHVLQLVLADVGAVTGHRRRHVLRLDVEVPLHRRARRLGIADAAGPGRDRRDVHRPPTFVRDERLRPDVDVDPFVGVVDPRRKRRALRQDQRGLGHPRVAVGLDQIALGLAGQRQRLPRVDRPLRRQLAGVVAMKPDERVIR